MAILLIALIFQFVTGGFSTFPTLRGLLRCQRADPSTALDEMLYSCSHLSGMSGGCQDYVTFPVFTSSTTDVPSAALNSTFWKTNSTSSTTSGSMSSSGTLC